MTILTEGKRTAEFLISEAEHCRSRDTVTVTVPDGGYEAGTVMGQITASGKFVRHNAAAADGSETEAGVLFANLDNETGAPADMPGTIIARAAQVLGSALTYEVGADATQITTSNTALAAIGVIVR